MDALFSKKVTAATFSLARLGYAEVEDPSLTLRRSQFSEASGKLRSDHDLAGLITVSSTYIDLYRGGVNVFRGRIAEPLVHGPDWVEFVAYDEWWWLHHEYRETSSRLTISADHLKTMIEADTGPHAPRINTTYMSFASGGPDGTVVIEAGTSKDDDAKRIIEAFRHEAGFVPYYDVQAELTEWGMFPLAFYPGGVLVNDPPITPVTDREQVRFEYGEGTIANLDNYRRETLLPRNRVVAFGPGEGESRETAALGDDDSLAEFGKVATTATFETSVDLTADARTALIADPPRVYSVVVGPEAPMLWDDFYVGDYVRLRVRDGAVDDNVSVRVDAVTVVGEDGSERIASIVLMTEDAILQASGGLSGVSPTVDVTIAEFLALTPEEGDRVRITDANNWTFQYDADEATEYKWKFVTGEAMTDTEAGTFDTGDGGFDYSTSGSTGLPLAGPQIVVPLAGVYNVTFQADLQVSPPGNNGAICASEEFVAFASASADAGATASGDASHTFARGANFNMGYAETEGDGTASFSNRVSTLTPVKVSQS